MYSVIPHLPVLDSVPAPQRVAGPEIFAFLPTASSVASDTLAILTTAWSSLKSQCDARYLSERVVRVTVHYSECSIITTRASVPCLDILPFDDIVLSPSSVEILWDTCVLDLLAVLAIALLCIVMQAYFVPTVSICSH